MRCYNYVLKYICISSKLSPIAKSSCSAISSSCVHINNLESHLRKIVSLSHISSSHPIIISIDYNPILIKAICPNRGLETMTSSMSNALVPTAHLRLPLSDTSSDRQNYVLRTCAIKDKEPQGSCNSRSLVCSNPAPFSFISKCSSHHT